MQAFRLQGSRVLRPSGSLSIPSRFARLVFTALALALTGSILFNRPLAAQSSHTGTITILYRPGRPANVFRPAQAFGACVDGLGHGEIAKVYTPANIHAMLSAGFKPLSYRLRTELGIEAWHWNPEGTWSDPERQQGYWTSDDTSSAPIMQCYGYRLPRRGNTIDQANNRGYSRMDDGDTTTFWKSNPYLDSRFTKEADSRHPQWVVIALGKLQTINAIRILWGCPYATNFRVEYRTGPDPMASGGSPEGDWRVFPNGRVTRGRGGDSRILLSSHGIRTQFLRIWMLRSSHTAPPGSRDVRDRLGYSIQEIYAGMQRADGLHDVIRHGPGWDRQTVLYASSTDPWHRSSDLDPAIEQPGFDRVYASGLTKNLPLMAPVATLYDTPENAAAEIRYLKSRNYPVREIEIGEEPDGQYILPEDYAALYMQWAKVLHRVDPTLKLGGPGFQSSIDDYLTWPDAAGNASWINRFLACLKARGQIRDYNFFTFEWYPFDNVCADTAPQLAAAPYLLARMLNRLHSAGLPRDIPLYISEYGYSSFAGQPEVDRAGAILNAEIVAQWLTEGGGRAYFYGYEPADLMKELSPCDSWGNLALFLSNSDRIIKQPLATYHGARLLTQEWAEPGDRIHEVFTVRSDMRNSRGQALVTGYAVKRPDGAWALLLLNKDPHEAWKVKVHFREPASNGSADMPTKPLESKIHGAKKAAVSSAETDWRGQITEVQFSGSQYVWHPKGRVGYAQPDREPESRVVSDAPNRMWVLPPYSITVLRGQREYP